MTYNEVKATGAEILDAFVAIPTEGWTEIAVERIREIYEDATRQVEQLAKAFNADAYQQALLLKNSASKALGRAQAGGRVFVAPFEDGSLAFAATKIF